MLALVSAAGAVDKPVPLAAAPQFSLPGLDRKIYRLSDFRGRVLVVNFWASWCLPCRQELPSMNRAVKILRDAPVDWVAVNLGEHRQAVEAFRGDYPIDFPVLLDADGQLSKRWWVSGMPTTFIVDRGGYLAHKIVGKREWDDARTLRLLRRLADAAVTNR